MYTLMQQLYENGIITTLPTSNLTTLSSGKVILEGDFKTLNDKLARFLVFNKDVLLKDDKKEFNAQDFSRWRKLIRNEIAKYAK